VQPANLITDNAVVRRSGTTLLEVIAAGAILGVLLIVCAQMLSRAVVQQQAIAHRRAALQMACNAMERAQAQSWDEVDGARMESIAQAVVEQGMLRNGRVVLVVDQPESMPPSKRIHVTVSWTEGSDEVERKQELTAWRYSQEPEDKR
jgi:type II secretory pathway component PulJ